MMIVMVGISFLAWLFIFILVGSAIFPYWVLIRPLRRSGMRESLAQDVMRLSHYEIWYWKRNFQVWLLGTIGVSLVTVVVLLLGSLVI